MKNKKEKKNRGLKNVPALEEDRWEDDKVQHPFFCILVKFRYFKVK